MALIKVRKRAAISPNVKATVKTVREVEQIIKKNDDFCKHTKRHNIASMQLERGVKVLTNKSDILELKERIKRYKENK